MTMRIAHVSDTHGRLPKLGNSIAVFHSGDFLPNNSRGIITVEEPFQRDWMALNMDPIKDWLAGRAFIFCAGNHDFFDPIPMMRKAGISAFNVTNKTETIMGMQVHGFPYIPYIAGEWNYELRGKDLAEKVELIPWDLDILMAHCPPDGVLFEPMDGSKAFGNAALTNWLSYSCEQPPRNLLCGHAHESNGIKMMKLGDHTVLVSNAATTVHHIEL